MKHLRFIGLLISLPVVTVCFTPLIAQEQPQSQTVTTGKKKSGFVKFLESSVIVNGKPIGGSSGSTNSTPGRSLAGTTTIKGEWTEYGGGGAMNGENLTTDFSPRNHVYYIDITQNNAKLIIRSGSQAHITTGMLYNPSGNKVCAIWFNQYAQEQTIDRAGTYKIIVQTSKRNQLDAYEIQIDGPVANVHQDKPQYWHEDKLAFDKEGSGGVDYRFSPRNHKYTFEPKRGSVFDVNLESSEGIHVKVSQPDGKRVDRAFGQAGESAVGRAEISGLYSIYIYSDQPNQLASYKLEVIGKLEKTPVLDEVKQTLLKGHWDSNNRKHEYILIAQPGYQEVLYRSRTTNGSLYYIGADGTVINGDYSLGRQSNREQSLVIQATQPGELHFFVETDQVAGGDYELLVTGKFDKVDKKEVKTPNQKTIKQPTTIQSTSTPSQKTIESVFVNGRVRVSQPMMSLTTMHIVYEDLDSGEKLGEVSPDEQGNYSFSLPVGRRYGITVISDDNYIASSQNVDLTKRIVGQQKISVNDLTVISGEVGEVINLNNIFFQTGKATLLPASYTELNRIGKYLNDHPTIHIEISGHTDNQGSVPINKTLSNDRALAVMYNLQGQHISQGRIKAVGYGPTKPVSTNTTENGRALNRRVEFRVISQ